MIENEMEKAGEIGIGRCIGCWVGYCNGTYRDLRSRDALDVLMTRNVTSWYTSPG